MFTETEYTLLIPFPCLNHVHDYDLLYLDGNYQIAGKTAIKNGKKILESL